MKSINFEEMADYVNKENLNFEGNKIRKGQIYGPHEEDANARKYLDGLTDIAHLCRIDLLRYRLGDVHKLRMFNIAMQAKGILANKNPYLNVEISTSSNMDLTFSVYVEVENTHNNYSKIRISDDRTYEIINNSEIELVQEMFEEIRQCFLTLINEP